jgi:hypothetical protein
LENFGQNKTTANMNCVKNQIKIDFF